MIEPKILRYIHLFKDRKTMVDVIVDLSQDDIEFKANLPYKVTDETYDEYSYWLINFVQKDIIDRLSEKQIRNLSLKGAKYLKFYL